MGLGKGLFLMLCCQGGMAWSMPPAEDAKAKALLVKVEANKDATFVRNGTEYSSANAAEFLRRKCAKEWDKLASAREFVSNCAAQSSTSGKPYQIRLKGGVPRPSAEVLGEWLEQIERGGK